MDIENLRSELRKFGQEHLLKFWPKLSEEEKILLYNDLISINYTEVTEIFQRTTINKSSNEKLDEILQPIPNEYHGSVSQLNPQKRKMFREKGLKQIADNKVAVLLLAGGQGTRLGVSYPKGMYDVGLPSHKSLYQLQAERIQRLQYLSYKSTGCHGKIIWYIMTSEHTMEPTVEYFKKNNYFNLDKNNIFIFEQNMIPCFTFDGKIILETPYKIARAPDGNGGLYKVLKNEKVLDDMKARGVNYIHVYCVDNILVKMADPVFIGYSISRDADCAAKVVEKAFPTEAVGVVCKVNGQFQVVEYSEISLTVAQKRNPDGRLMFNAGNICNHFFTLEFLQRVANGPDLPYHIAKKKIPYVDDEGTFRNPNESNGIKFEKFVFDVFDQSNKFAVWEVIRDEEFSPLKNADGADKDTPTTARHALFQLHQKYVLNAGGRFIAEDNVISSCIANSAERCFESLESAEINGHGNEINSIQKSYCKSEDPIICEISPLVSYDGEELENLVTGKTFRSPLVIYAESEKAEGNGIKIKTSTL